jgi:hypothetical protein
VALISINSCFLYILKGINGSNTLHDSENDSPNIMNDSLKREGMHTNQETNWVFILRSPDGISLSLLPSHLSNRVF